LPDLPKTGRAVSFPNVDAVYVYSNNTFHTFRRELIMKKILATLFVLAMLVPMAKADFFWTDADSWWYNADAAGTLTFTDNKNTFTFELVVGDNFLGLQRDFTGSLEFDGFEPAVEPEPAFVDVGFIGYYINEDNALSTSFYWVTLYEGEFFDWADIDAAYAGWVADGGGLEPDRTIWQTSGFASFTFADYAAIGFDDFTEGQLEGYYQAFFVDPGYILPPVVVDPDPVVGGDNQGGDNNKPGDGDANDDDDDDGDSQ